MRPIQRASRRNITAFPQRERCHASDYTQNTVTRTVGKRDAYGRYAASRSARGDNVRGVYSSRQVMGHVIDFDPDVVLLDIAMPELSGWEVARTIRAGSGADRPLLIGISGEYIKGADKVLSQILGFDHYLAKPYAPAELLALLAPLKDPSAG
jgi:DNA-binding response OmpR family regulator